MESVDKIHGIHGQSPAGVLKRKQWTISSESMENVHGFFPVSPWIFFMESMDFVQGDSGNNPWTMSMEIFHGHCPWTFEQ